MEDFPGMNSAGMDEGIDLSGYSTMTGGSAPAGYHVGVISKCESKPTQAGAKMLHITYTTPRGTVRDRLTIAHPRAGTDSKAKTAVEIGLRKIKSILTYGTRDGETLDASRYRGPASLLGVRVGLLAVIGDDFTGTDGKLVKGVAEVTPNGRPYYTEGEIAQLSTAA